MKDKVNDNCLFSMPLINKCEYKMKGDMVDF